MRGMLDESYFDRVEGSSQMSVVEDAGMSRVMIVVLLFFD